MILYLVLDLRLLPFVVALALAAAPALEAYAVSDFLLPVLLYFFACRKN